MEGDQIEFKDISKLFLIPIIVIGFLNFAYADSGPTIGANQAQITASNYLSSHNLHYTAVTPDDNDWQIKVNDTKTGEVKWITMSEYSKDMYEHGGSDRYMSIQNVPTVWIVHVNDNWKSVGQIYIDSETGEILKVVINGKTLENMIKEGNQTNDLSASTNADNSVPQEASDNTIRIVLSIIILIAVIGVGYWIYSNRRD